MSTAKDNAGQSPFDEVNARLDEAADLAGVPVEALSLLKAPYREIQVQIPIFRT